MKKNISALFVMAATFTYAQSPDVAKNTDLTPAGRSIAEGNKAIIEKPAQYASYNLLAIALVRRAEETSDVSFYAQADNVLKKSLELAPHNFDTEKIRVSILLGKHEYPAALEAAKALNKGVPDDVMVYGLLTDANTELGNYRDAEDSAQWMLNLRPGNLPALTRAAHLRELFGDVEGAYELMDLAYQSTPPTEAGERASILTQMGHLRLASGNTGAAEQLLERALTLFPGYPFALDNLAQVRVGQKRYQDAVLLLQQRNQTATCASNLYQLAGALELAGRAAEAKKIFAEFETKALQESGKKDNSNLDLVFYYVDRGQQPAKALQFAERQYAWRRDVYTLDAYAWALHCNGRDTEAHKQIEAALAVGIRNARLFRHAGVIALKSGDRVAAEGYLKQAAELNTADSEQARSMLASLAPGLHDRR